MGNVISNMWLGVRPGDRAFSVLTNMCDYFRVGTEDGEDVWLEGQIVDDDFVFNGRLFMHNGQGGTVIDNFPKSPAPEGWTREPSMDGEGYTLRDPRGELVFSYHVNGKTCVVKLDLYRSNGTPAVHGGQGGLVIDVPALLGRNGVAIE